MTKMERFKSRLKKTKTFIFRERGVKLRLKNKITRTKSFIKVRYVKITSFAKRNKYTQSFIIGFTIIIILYFTRRWIIKPVYAEENPFWWLEIMGDRAQTVTMRELLGTRTMVIMGICSGIVLLWFFTKITTKKVDGKSESYAKEIENIQNGFFTPKEINSPPSSLSRAEEIENLKNNFYNN